MAENHFDNAAATWDDNPRRMALNKAVAQAIRDTVALTPATHMLEFGCGTATMSVLLADWVGHIQSVDTSSGMIAEVQRKLLASPELASIIHPSVLSEPICEHLRGTWDLICSSLVLHHIDDALGTLRHLAGRLRPGGSLAIADLYPEDGSFHGEQKVPHNGFDPQTLADALADEGLGQIQFQRVMTFTKTCADGVARDYSLFLLTAQRDVNA